MGWRLALVERHKLNITLPNRRKQEENIIDRFRFDVINKGNIKGELVTERGKIKVKIKLKG